MLKPRILVNVLQQANTGGVENTMIFNREGCLLAYAGQEEEDVRVIAAIASNIWSAYEKNCRTTFREDRLKFLIVNCEKGNVIVTQLNNLLLCMQANENVGLGLLKQKAEALASYVQEPLRTIT